MVYARPLVTTTFRAVVTDMATASLTKDGPQPKQAVWSVEVKVASVLAVSIQQAEYMIKAGDSAQLKGVATGGEPPFTVKWTLKDGSPATALSLPTGAPVGVDPSTILQPVANPTTTTEYKLTVTDSVGQSKSANTKVTVTPASASAAPSGSSTPSGSGSGSSSFGASDDTSLSDGQSNQQNTQTPSEVSGKEESAPVVTAPMCGFGVTSWVMVGNMLALAVMKRRRW